MDKADGLHATVVKGGGSGIFEFGKYFPDGIEEDVWHPVRLIKIVNGESTYKSKTSPAWIWVYEFQGEEFTYEDEPSGKEKQYILIEKTSQKLSTPPRASKAYTRYCQLIGREPTIGEDIDLQDLFGTECKLMISNTQGDKIVFHNIEKITIKGQKKEKSRETEKKESKKKTIKKATKEKDTSKDDNEPTPEAEDDIFKGLI